MTTYASRYETPCGRAQPMRFDSPLRYPGGKSSLAGFLARLIDRNGLKGCTYAEPYAGGAGAALRLLREGIVSQIYLNDLDPRIYSFWRAVLDDTERFEDKIRTIAINVQEWHRQRDIYRHADTRSQFELGFATFYLNRCNRSGIIQGGAPIGGYGQQGKWKIDSRFYRDSLATRVHAIGSRREQINVTHMDALDFITTPLMPLRNATSSFIYLDPPYYAKGQRLYYAAYDDSDHTTLAHTLRAGPRQNWLVSYDDSDFIRDLYHDWTITPLPIRYSLQQRRDEQEILIAPSHLGLDGCTAGPPFAESPSSISST